MPAAKDLYAQIQELNEEAEKDTEENKEVESSEKETEQEVETKEEVSEEKAKDKKEEVENEESKSKKEPEKSEEEKQPEEKPDSAAFARMRREKSELERQLRLMQQQQQQIQQQQNQKQPEPVQKKVEPDDPEPNKSLDLEAWLEWKDRQIEKKANSLEEKLNEVYSKQAQQEQQYKAEQSVKAAAKAFQTLEEEFRKNAPDYDDVALFYHGKLKESFIFQNPGLSEEEAAQYASYKILLDAKSLAKDHHNPVEYMYYLAKERFGYKPVQKQEDSETKTEEKQIEKKPDFRKVIENKKRSGTPATAGGKSGNAPLTRGGLLNNNMTVGEFSRLDPSAIRKLEEN